MIQMGPPRLDNDTISQLQPQPWIQRKMVLGEPGDRYEQKADRVASQVVQQINAPDAKESDQGPSVRRKIIPQEWLNACRKSGFNQYDPLNGRNSRQAAQSVADDFQEPTTIQRKGGAVVGEVSTNLESAINSARGSGQSLDAGLQQSMGQVMGADFSRVRVHTDAQSDQLNQSIQARAFTTRQDVFFRSGAYQPGNRERQELIAHELTHVVQQNNSTIQRKGGQERSGKQKNMNRLPSNLQVGIESLSGISTDDITVHYNSVEPSKVQALAYTEGTEIYLAPGQEKHLSHEAWHVVQQKQGRVRPTTQVRGVAVNDNPHLEREADVMGEQSKRVGYFSKSKAIKVGNTVNQRENSLQRKTSSLPVVQRMLGMNSKGINKEIKSLTSDPLNIPKLTEAYTFMQHISWAHNIVGGQLFDMSDPKFNNIGKSENLILVAHGLEGQSGPYNGATIAGFLADKKTGVPLDWEGNVYITSCYSGAGASPLVKQVAESLTVLGRDKITVTGYAGTTVTHKEFDEVIFVVDPKKEKEFKEISDSVALKYQHLFIKWYKKIQGLNPSNVLEMADYTSNLTAAAYKEMVEKAASQDIFLDEAHGEVSSTS